MMLDFYGLQLVNRETGEVARAMHYAARYRNLTMAPHNNLRITRILTSLGHLARLQRSPRRTTIAISSCVATCFFSLTFVCVCVFFFSQGFTRYKAPLVELLAREVVKTRLLISCRSSLERFWLLRSNILVLLFFCRTSFVFNCLFCS